MSVVASVGGKGYCEEMWRGGGSWGRVVVVVVGGSGGTVGVWLEVR